MKFLKIVTVVLLSALFSGCDNWLEITPQGEVSEESLLKDELGYMELLTGTYTLLGDFNLYGSDLICGAIDQLAQYWELTGGSSSSLPPLEGFADYNYKDEVTENRIVAIWSKMYQAVGNINLLLNNLNKENPNRLRYHDIIKGEALGLRAFMHFDLFRLFGPVVTDGRNRETLSIPYRTEFSERNLSLMPVGVVLDSIHNDLIRAYNLLKSDPVVAYGRRNDIAPSNRHLSFEFRGTRLNYYAVAAMLARYHLLIGEKQKAASYAMEVINATYEDIDKGELQAFSLYDPSAIANDKIFMTELVFGLYKKSLYFYHFRTFSGAQTIESAVRRDYTLRLTAPWRGKIFIELGEGGADDYRLRSDMWIESVYPTKLRWMQGIDHSTSELTQPLLPMIRITEMYYIAAEAAIGSDNKEAVRLINEVRKARNLQPVIVENYDNNTLLDLIVDESRKDFVAEGKMFYLYKRLNRDIMTLGLNPIPASDKIFVLPIPNDEIEYGGN